MYLYKKIMNSKLKVLHLFYASLVKSFIYKFKAQAAKISQLQEEKC